MAYKDLHKLKKIEVAQKEVIQLSTLLLGDGPYAIPCERQLIPDGLSQRPLFGPSTRRGDTEDLLSVFYKDGAFRPFGGRMKSETLKPSEVFYTKPKSLDDEQRVEVQCEHVMSGTVKEIKRWEGGRFCVELTNGTELICEKLVTTLSPSLFLSLYKNKSELGDGFMEFCEKTKRSTALLVRFILKRPMSDKKETFFIPLSLTHEWGHFIGEFKERSLEVIHFIDEDQTSEEDVARIIRLLKRSLEKIFPEFTKSIKEEFIAIEKEFGPAVVDDELYAKSSLDHLEFLGETAPLKVPCDLVGHARAIQRESEFSNLTES